MISCSPMIVIGILGGVLAVGVFYSIHLGFLSFFLGMVMLNMISSKTVQEAIDSLFSWSLVAIVLVTAGTILGY